MKRLLITTAFFVVAGGFWIFFGDQNVNRDKYITQNILDMSRPIDVTIDIEFLRSLKPAYIRAIPGFHSSRDDRTASFGCIGAGS
ncbi:MAG: hypothetical protein UV90_C0005G0115 [candidate division WWE3 bacterium GW2011_GWA2_43_24]|nr:MAG: hypothetical protein UV90_C0005G0115 [candidate division WWE3 bacterium GW2011_GWA2_43_24]